MTELPKRRQSIHPEDVGNLDKTKEVMCLCVICNEKFLVNEETETKMNDQEAEEYINIQKKKGDVDSNFSTSKKIKCRGCKIRHAREENYMRLLLVALLVLIPGIVFKDKIMFYYNRSLDTPVKDVKETKENVWLEKHLYKLEELYGKQIEDTWITLLSGIKSVVRETPNKPSMFLMLFDSDAAGNTAKCIAQAVSKPAMYYLLNNNHATPEIVYGRELNRKLFLDEPGMLLEKLKIPVKKKGALVLVNLHEVPAKVAKMFHYVCDRYSPLVETAVTFFTLKVDKMPLQHDLQMKAQQTLLDLWSSVLEDTELQPLIARMTSNIIRIYPESHCAGI